MTWHPWGAIEDSLRAIQQVSHLRGERRCFCPDHLRMEIQSQHEVCDRLDAKSCAREPPCHDSGAAASTPMHCVRELNSCELRVLPQRLTEQGRWEEGSQPAEGIILEEGKLYTRGALHGGVFQHATRDCRVLLYVNNSQSLDLSPYEQAYVPLRRWEFFNGSRHHHNLDRARWRRPESRRDRTCSQSSSTLPGRSPRTLPAVFLFDQTLS